LHTNDAPGAATRLVEMGVEPYLVASSVEVVVAQRLVRVICPKCKREAPESAMRKAREEFGALVPPVLYYGAGCRNCQETGFRGRQGIFEVMAITDEIRGLILRRAPSHELRNVATRQGMKSLREDGWRIVADGRTTIAEVITNTKDEEVAAIAMSQAAPAPAPGGVS
jgi:type II secretory ATPase GspE/PulE/Tfp pilus assembly ATPase PilB-like protein